MGRTREIGLEARAESGEVAVTMDAEKQQATRKYDAIHRIVGSGNVQRAD